jgi:pimeloyl-ACP methyl ester carboxylesterase
MPQADTSGWKRPLNSVAQRERRWDLALAIGGSFAVTAGIGIMVLLRKLQHYVDPYGEKVAAAGFVQKSVSVNQVNLSYVEGPRNGPSLLLLHAQFLDWFSYSRVMPELAKSFHVFVVDYPGHGKTTTPADYPMTANQIGADLCDFIERQIGEPVYVTGNSSGGLLATWLAAWRPQWIRAALLEDPPLFSAEFPRIQTTIAFRAFATSYRAIQDHPTDFLLYWIRDNAAFFRKNVGPGSAFLLTEAIRAFRGANPGRPVLIGLLPNDTVRMLLRGLDEYDPRFGAAFYDGTWNLGFDHAEALRSIVCPTLLMQANYTILPDGTLNGAMNQDDAQRAISLLKDGSYQRVDATHVVHLDQPATFLRILKDFFLEV